MALTDSLTAKDAVNMKIKNGVVELEVKANDGTSINKKVALVDLCAELAKFSKTYVQVLPPGVRLIAENNGKAYVLFMTPAFVGKCELEWNRYDCNDYGNFEEESQDTTASTSGRKRTSRVFTVPYPATAMIASFTINGSGYLLKELHCYALKADNLPLGMTQVYHWPFTNVFDSAKCCLGEVDYVSLRAKTMEGLAYVPKLVYKGVGNHDLEEGILEQDPKNVPFGRLRRAYELITRLHKEKLTEFPLGYLKSFGSGITLKDVFESISGLKVGG